jgi:hypothetical protein
MIKQITFSEFEDNLDQYLDQVENNKLLEFHIVDHQGKPVARLISNQAGQGEEQPLLVLENKIKSLESRRQKIIEVQKRLNNHPISFQLASLLTLEPGWMDGYGEQISLEAVETTLEFLTSDLQSLELDLLDIFPRVCGGIIIDRLELISSSRWMLDIEKEGQFGIVIIEKDEDSFLDQVTINQAIESYRSFNSHQKNTNK